MSRILVVLLASLALSASSLQVSAQSRDCPDGKVYDPDTGKCVTPRGSH